MRLDEDQLRTLANMIAAKLQPPRWLTYELAAKYSSLSTRTLETHVNRGLIKSRNAKDPNATRGRRLIDRLSLDAFIEGSGDEPAGLGMNRKRPKKQPTPPPAKGVAIDSAE